MFLHQGRIHQLQECLFLQNLIFSRLGGACFQSKKAVTSISWTTYCFKSQSRTQSTNKETSFNPQSNRKCLSRISCSLQKSYSVLQSIFHRHHMGRTQRGEDVCAGKPHEHAQPYDQGFFMSFSCGAVVLITTPCTPLFLCTEINLRGRC